MIVLFPSPLIFKVCIEKTGGQIVLGDSFGQSVFKESLARLFRKPMGEDGKPFPAPPPEHGGGAALLQMGFGATLEVIKKGFIEIIWVVLRWERD